MNSECSEGCDLKTPLHHAIFYDRFECMTELVQQGADIANFYSEVDFLRNGVNRTLIDFAIEHRDDVAAQLIIKELKLMTRTQPSPQGSDFEHSSDQLAASCRRMLQTIISNVDCDDVITYLYAEKAITLEEWENTIATAYGNTKRVIE